ncbi:hypothetical protein [Microbacterium marinilacus]|uniref:Uncharacterized protein n=1 Tax=Microbacterium marinilacus TaxID=415209 RepID=A0ABP7B7R3_9MICO|nr:hypothetical protein [Microbacterium marinilacus]MBY0687342.1 hypothetical protein [Microbacterium marinilacus]
MIPVDGAQIWTIIGVLSAGLFGLLTLISTMFVRVVQAEIGGLRTELRTEVGGLRAEMSAKLDGIDRDVQFLMRREADRP